MFIQSTSRKQVAAKYPSAEKIVKVCGGYMVFYSIDDYAVWKNQK